MVSLQQTMTAIQAASHTAACSARASRTQLLLDQAAADFPASAADVCHWQVCNGVLQCNPADISISVVCQKESSQYQAYNANTVAPQSSCGVRLLVCTCIDQVQQAALHTACASVLGCIYVCCACCEACQAQPPKAYTAPIFCLRMRAASYVRNIPVAPSTRAADSTSHLQTLHHK